jgi:hypothetical protein
MTVKETMDREADRWAQATINAYASKNSGIPSTWPVIKASLKTEISKGLCESYNADVSRASESLAQLPGVVGRPVLTGMSVNPSMPSATAESSIMNCEGSLPYTAQWNVNKTSYNPGTGALETRTYGYQTSGQARAKVWAGRGNQSWIVNLARER